jgi:hypothetical protein
MTVLTDRAPLGTHDLESLIPSALFTRLATRVARETGADHERAERVVRAALAFLVACARNPETPLAPSRAVDEGWHAFVLHTREYADFCERVAGRFIHHAPEDEPAGEPLDVAARSGMTAVLMRHSGLPVDEELWSTKDGSCSANCGRCCSDHGSG